MKEELYKMDNKVKVSFVQTASISLSFVPIEDGQLIFTKDTHKLYRDVGSERVLICGGKTFAVSQSQPTDLETNGIWFIVKGE